MKSFFSHKSVWFPLLLLGILLIEQAQCDKILIFMGTFTSHSPTASIQPLADKLASRGHQVTLYSPVSIPNRHPKVRLFCPPEVKSFFTDTVPKLGARSLNSRVNTTVDFSTMSQLLFFAFDQGHDSCKAFIESPSVVDLLKKEKFDLVIVDSAFNECGFPLAYLFQAKTAIYGTFGTVLWWDMGTFGIPSELSWLPGFVSAYEGGKLSFLDRLANAAMIFTMSSIYRGYHLPNMDKLFRESYLADRVKDMPPMDQLVGNASLYLVNQHHSHQFPRSYPPFVVPVGGMHVNFELNGTLPPEMETFIGKSDFVYVSFGSFIQVSTMPMEIIQNFFDVFASFSNLKFLWKWEGELPKKHPKNIFFHPWFPQESVLAHPRIRGFISQGGQIAVQQGVCHGVPFILCPVEADQDYNTLRVMTTGSGIKLELAGLTSSQLEQALNKILNEPSYAQNAKKLAISCKDRPMSAVDTATWWVEYVLRTDDTSLMKPLRHSQPLWKLWNLDLWAFLFSIALVFILISLLVVKWLVGKLYRCVVPSETKGAIKVKRS